MSLRQQLFLAALITVACARTVVAADLPLFRDDTVLKAVLTAPIAQVYAEKLQDSRVEHPGQLTYIDENGETQRLDVSIRTRGNFRRVYCDNAPLRLNFKKSQVKGTLFADQNKMKIVAPCGDGALYQRYVVLEYLAYRTLQVLTDYSYRTRMIRLSYVDSEEKMAPWTSLVFVIEDDGDMADRLGLQRLHVEEVRFAELDRAKTALAELFQLMIGNNDYSILKSVAGEECCHNSDILAVDEAGLRIPIPFDFDFSGLVNSKYAAPPDHLPITKVRHRYYTGLCHPPGVLEDALAHVSSKRDEIEAVFEKVRPVNENAAQNGLAYIQSFFKLLDTPKRVEKEIFGRCRGAFLLDAMMKLSTDPT
jgi:hypothetical protein